MNTKIKLLADDQIAQITAGREYGGGATDVLAMLTDIIGRERMDAIKLASGDRAFGPLSSEGS